MKYLVDSMSVAIIICLAIASVRDVLTRMIPNWVSLVVGGLGIALRLAAGIVPLGYSFSVAVGLFCLLFLGYRKNAIGGGDVKLMTALAVGLTPLNVVRFVVITVVMGGVLGIVYLCLRYFVVLRPVGRKRNFSRRIIAIESWRARRERSVPYAVPIALGAAVVIASNIAR